MTAIRPGYTPENEAEILRGVMASGVRVLQPYRYAPTERGHVAVLLWLMAPPPDAVILDAGCGIGEVSRLMHEMRPDLRFVLLNDSETQLLECPVGGPFERRLADFHTTGLPDQSVDVVMLNAVIGHADLPRLLIECARVLKTGGILTIEDHEWAGGEHPEWLLLLHYRTYSEPQVRGAATAAGFDRGHSRSMPATAEHFLALTGPKRDECEAALRDLLSITYRFVKGNQ